MRTVRTEEEIKRHQQFMDAKKVKIRALMVLDLQNLPPERKQYRAEKDETLILLDAGADILKFRSRKDYVFLKLMYEGVPVKYEAEGKEANGFTHPRLK